MNETRKTTSKWWRYLLAVLVFIVISDVFPMIFAFLWSLLDLFTPKYFKSGFAWTCILAYGATPFVALNVAMLIVGNDMSKKDSVFYLIVSTLWMFWCGFIAIKNYSAGLISFEVACGMLFESLVLLFFAVLFLAVIFNGKIKFLDKIVGKIFARNSHDN